MLISNNIFHWSFIFTILIKLLKYSIALQIEAEIDRAIPINIPILYCNGETELELENILFDMTQNTSENS